MNQTPLIAIVDDEESVCRAIKRLLRSAQLDVETFQSGNDFLDALSSHAFDCVILDLHMSGRNGFEVQSSLQRSGNPLPVIIITGHDTPTSRARATAGGASAYLLKPVDEALLLESIALAVGSQPKN